MLETARAALDQWVPVWIVIDGSTDGSAEEAAAWAQSIGQDRVRVFRLPENRGKGSAIYTGLQAAVEAGFEAILTMDADGQHPADLIPEFMRLSRENPGALILGKPIFGAEAPPERVKGREISNWWARAVTAGGDIGDSLFGFRVYPAKPLLAAMDETRWARRFDFDAETAIRLVWRGTPTVNVPAPCKYLTAEQGGVSHFRYGRDNVLLIWMYARLCLGFLRRLPWILLRRRRK